jgi:hypothetical protein
MQYKLISLPSPSTIFSSYKSSHFPSDESEELAGRENRFIYLFLKIIIIQQKSKYTYGYKFNERHMNIQSVFLPVSADQKSDWTYIDQYTKSMITQ